MKFKAMMFAALMTFSFAAAAHSPGTGKNGGQNTDAGDYHLEVLAKDKSLTVFLSDHNDKSIPSTGFKGTAILVVDGKAQRITLAPDAENKLVGSADVDLKAPLKGVVQITNSVNKTAQGKLE